MHRNKRITYIVIWVLILTAIIYLFRDKNKPVEQTPKKTIEKMEQE